MTTNDKLVATTEAPPHFEALWNNAEEITHKMYYGADTMQIIKDLEDQVARLRQIQESNVMPEIKLALKQQKLGEIIFTITALTKRDDINIYEHLQKEMLVNMDAYTPAGVAADSKPTPIV